MSVVELDDAVAVLGQFPALAGATLRVDEGEIVLLRGPNGAGKTTLLRLCAGLLPLVRGTGSVLGLDLTTHRESIRRTVGLLGHQNGLYLDLTVSENVRFWARRSVRRMPRCAPPCNASMSPGGSPTFG